MPDDFFGQLFGGMNSFSGPCALCGQSTFGVRNLVDSKAGKVHAECNLDISKWRKWFKQKEEAECSSR